MSRLSDAQDGFSQLVEECRLWTVFRSDMTGKRAQFISHNPEIDLSDVPVFYCGVVPERIDLTEVVPGLEALEAGRFRLPYPRCAFLYYVPSDHIGLMKANEISGKPNGASREYAMIVEEEEDGSILMYSFFRTELMKHWAKQAWQCVLNPPRAAGEEGHIEISYDPINEDTSDEFMLRYLEANKHRVAYLIAQIHRIVTGGGRVTYGVGGTHTERVDARRAKAGLSPIPRIRIIEFDETPFVPEGSKGGGSGTMKTAHFRRGTWRSLATGRRVWVKASAIHGGTPDVPPWYEIR